jgi:hypothetical protein
MGGGLRMIARAYGGIRINGEDWLWDYAQDRAISPAELREREAKAKAEREAKREQMRAAKAAQGDLL